MARTSNERALEVPLRHVCFCHHCQIYIVSTSTTCTVRKLLCVLATGDETVFERSFGTADRRIATCLITTAWCDVPDQAIFLGAKTGGGPKSILKALGYAMKGVGLVAQPPAQKKSISQPIWSVRIKASDSEKVDRPV